MQDPTTDTAVASASPSKDFASDCVFFYGTLRAGQDARAFIEPFVAHTKPAHVNGRMYAFADGYPGVVVDDHATVVVGEVTKLCDTDKALALIDAFFGDEFRRTIVTAKLEKGGLLSCWCYTLARESLAEGAKRIDSGDWITFDDS